MQESLPFCSINIHKIVNHQTENKSSFLGIGEKMLGLDEVGSAQAVSVSSQCKTLFLLVIIRTFGSFA
jgi:hypothetical protein